MADTSPEESSPHRQLASKSPLRARKSPKSSATTSTSEAKQAKGRPSRKPSSHPKYSEMITTAITILKEKNGSSRHAILKYIRQNYKLGGDEKAINSRLKAALKAGVASKMIKQSTGIGASGSFSVTDAGRKAAVAAKAGKRRSPTKAKKGATATTATKKTAKSPKSKSPKSTTSKTKSPKPKTKSPKAATKKPKAKKEASSPKKVKSKPTVKPPTSKQSKSKQAKPRVKKTRTEK